MISSADILTAVLLGLAGSGHCLTMCGGVNSVVLLRDQPSATSADSLIASSTAPQSTLMIPLFSIGRITSYAFAGFLLGSVGLAVQTLGKGVMHWAHLFAGVLLLAMAAYTGRWWMGLTKLEALMAKPWQLLQPLTSQLIPARTPQAALLLGALWGWLPCGLVYSALAWSALSGGPLQSAALMFAFGLGTLPSMLGAGFFAHQLAGLLQRHNVQQAAAILLLLFALYTIYSALAGLSAGELNHHHSMGHS